MKEEYCKCPECGSDRISAIEIFEVVRDRDVKTGKIRDQRKIMSKYTMKRRQYACRKCFWLSEEKEITADDRAM